MIFLDRHNFGNHTRGFFQYSTLFNCIMRTVKKKITSYQ